MSLFSSDSTTCRGDRLSAPSNGISFTISAAPHGLYMAMVVGLIIILAIGSILALQMQPYTAPPGKTLGGHSIQRCLVYGGHYTGCESIALQGGECHAQIA